MSDFLLSDKETSEIRNYQLSGQVLMQVLSFEVLKFNSKELPSGEISKIESLKK